MPTALIAALLLMTLGLGSPSSEAAAEATTPATVPEALTPDAHDTDSLKKVGQAKLSVMFWDVYESALYTPDGEYREGVRPLRLEIRYLRAIPSEQLVAQTGKEWRAQSLAHPNQDDWLAQLEILWPDVQAGDVIAMELDAGEQARFTFNGEALGTIDDTDFGRQFAAIWLSPKTTRPALREQLIGSAQ